MKVEIDQHGTIRIKPETELECFALSQFNALWKHQHHSGIIIYSKLEEFDIGMGNDTTGVNGGV